MACSLGPHLPPRRRPPAPAAIGRVVHRGALAQFEVQLDPNATTRRRLADLIALLSDDGEAA